MTTTIDSYVYKFIINRYYEIWKNNPKFDKYKSFWVQYFELNLQDEVEDDIRWETQLTFTEEEINSIGWAERFEIIRWLYIDYNPTSNASTSLRDDIIERNWRNIFESYGIRYALSHFECCSCFPYHLFEMVLKEFKFKTAIAKIKRNKLFILGLSMKLSMRDCGLKLVSVN